VVTDEGHKPGQEQEIDADTIPPVTGTFWEELEQLLKNVPVQVVNDKLVEARIQRQAREHVKRKEREAPLPPRWRLRRHSA
jgi:hypothetical protein